MCIAFLYLQRVTVFGSIARNCRAFLYSFVLYYLQVQHWINKKWEARVQLTVKCQPMTDVGSEWETCLKTAIVFAVPFGETSRLEIINFSFKGKRAAFIFTRH